MSTANGPATFADDGSAVIEREIGVESVRHSDLELLYEIDRTVTRINEGGYKKIALQFPDELLADATDIASILRTRTKQDIFILADTSYGSCCVDEVAAEHVGADLIIHYGRSCLSPTSRLPVLYVFGQQQFDVDHCIQEVQQLLTDRSSPVIIMCDVEYSYAVGMPDKSQLMWKLNNALLESLTSKLAEEYTTVIPTKIQVESKLQSTLAKSPIKKKKESCGGDGCSGSCNHDLEDAVPSCTPHTLDVDALSAEKQKGGRFFELPEGVTIDMCSILFIGGESLTLTNIMMVHNKCQLYTYNPKTKEARRETVQVNKMLMKRYFLVQKAKDANTIGIVVGTLGVASYMNIIDHLKKLIKASGRKSYLFVMGKLNVAKMANFMEIDCYVLVACPENSLIDSKEFYRPIVTPFELEIALSRSKEWTGDYITDFSTLLPSLRTDGFTYDEEAEDASSDEEPHFSLVTGQYISSPFSKVSGKNNGSTEEQITSNLTDLTLRSKETSITTLLNSTAGEYLRNRSYRGLEARTGEDEAGIIQEGLSGIARGYSGEKNLSQDVE
ncbi:Diphthamide biosynthesis protein 2 [Apophysomyces sp. BC1034]|nr:Diphthamide biosynthesis protein 2 [Apophysomyces sp. BC1015]KAG0179014.1 Diphthamide biosynthesis protein 2 [Apophysomyces sp. BC1021]KAG0192123.1 Diphthamide biosynthesis protein 2 [Apophysomyces sp. BC1034]